MSIVVLGFLNMGKRIMDKVFSCADDCAIKVYYQDTGSIHLNYDDVPKTVDRRFRASW